MRSALSRLLLRALGVVAAGAVCHAAILYQVTLDTSPLIGHAAGPFSIDFQFNDGEGIGDANNTVTLSNFQFGGGGSVGSPLLSGGASGSVSGTVTLIDSSFFNAFTQQFTPGSALGFLLGLTTTVDPSGTPDQFSFAILDSTGFELPTLGLFDIFLVIEIDSAQPLAQAFASDPSRAPNAGGGPINLGAPVVTEIPEPTSWALAALGILAAVPRIAATRRV
jgi:hypothetical protein